MRSLLILVLLTLTDFSVVTAQDALAVSQNLWIDYSPTETHFKIWSPEADKVTLRLYDTGHTSTAQESLALIRNPVGVWETKVSGDLHGKYYTYQVQYKGETLEETTGIYTQAVGVNGHRSMVCDLKRTDPDGWSEDVGPTLKNKTNAVLYELHIRDLSVHPSSSVKHPGKYQGLVETGEGKTTPFDHIRDLGITHVHLLPTFDHYSIDESRLEIPQYNWGYDPQNYNVPEGSFSSDPFNAQVRIKEFKSMVQAFHKTGIGVILDVVYNHTGRTVGSNFNLEYPDYYYRKEVDGHYSNASGCGNETASEKLMMRKFIIESCMYWMKEYHIDGFRFDLMGIHDQETMNAVARQLIQINPDVLIYGEGWTAGDSPLPEFDRSLKKYTQQIYPVAVFSDDLRDGLKGSVFDEKDTGFISGKPGMEHSIAFGVIGSIAHPQINYKLVNYSDSAWAKQPYQCINYVSCHDNHTLWDKLNISKPEAADSTRIRMHKLALGVVLTSQGIPFLHAGTEFLRTKNGEHNSYKSPDTVNQIDWARKNEYKDVHKYVKGLIQLRKDHPALRISNAEKIRTHLKFISLDDQLVAYEINGDACGDDWKTLRVYYNGSPNYRYENIPGRWAIAVDSGEIIEKDRSWVGLMTELAPYSMTILYKK